MPVARDDIDIATSAQQLPVIVHGEPVSVVAESPVIEMPACAGVVILLLVILLNLQFAFMSMAPVSAEPFVNAVEISSLPSIRLYIAGGSPPVSLALHSI